MSTLVILMILGFHYLADFIMQDSYWADNKYHNFNALLEHTGMYSIFMLICGLFTFSTYYTLESPVSLIYLRAALFSIITFFLHTLVDYFTSKRTHKLFTEKRYGSPIPNLGAFSVIGFDQLLHYIQLILTFKFLLMYT